MQSGVNMLRLVPGGRCTLPRTRPNVLDKLWTLEEHVSSGSRQRGRPGLDGLQLSTVCLRPATALLPSASLFPRPANSSPALPLRAQSLSVLYL